MMAQDTRRICAFMNCINFQQNFTNFKLQNFKIFFCAYPIFKQSKWACNIILKKEKSPIFLDWTKIRKSEFRMWVHDSTLGLQLYLMYNPGPRIYLSMWVHDSTLGLPGHLLYNPGPKCTIQSKEFRQLLSLVL